MVGFSTKHWRFNLFNPTLRQLVYLQKLGKQVLYSTIFMRSFNKGNRLVEGYFMFHVPFNMKFAAELLCCPYVTPVWDIDTTMKYFDGQIIKIKGMKGFKAKYGMNPMESVKRNLELE